LPVSDDQPPRARRPVPTAPVDIKPPVERQAGVPSLLELDWEKIASGDQQPSSSPGSPPPGAVSQRGVIRLLVQNVARAGRTVEVALRHGRGNDHVVREIVPSRLRGTLILCVDNSSHETVTIDLNEIEWARLME
jgi:hypothetical protein